MGISFNIGTQAYHFTQTDFYRNNVNHEITAQVWLQTDYTDPLKYHFIMREYKNGRWTEDYENIPTLPDLINRVCIEGTTEKDFRNAIAEANKRLDWTSGLVRFFGRLGVDYTVAGCYPEIDGKYISFVPLNRLNRIFPYNEATVDMARTRTTPGRFLRKMFPDASDVVIEEYVDQIKETFMTNSIQLSVVSGEDIRFWYHEENYNDIEDTGDLANSCMRYSECQHQLDVYVENSNISMLIATNGGLLVGRSLIWNTNEGLFHDRIYANRPVQRLMEKYFSSRNIENCYCTNDRNQLCVELESAHHESWPYLDTFYYVKNGKMWNYRPEKPYGYLQDTEGAMTWEEDVTITENYFRNGVLISSDTMEEDAWIQPTAYEIPNYISWDIESSDGESNMSGRGTVDVNMFKAWADALRSGEYTYHNSEYHMKQAVYEDGRIERTYSAVGVLWDIVKEGKWDTKLFNSQVEEGQVRSFGQIDGTWRTWPRVLSSNLGGYGYHFAFFNNYPYTNVMNKSWEETATAIDQYVAQLERDWGCDGQDTNPNS